MNAVSKPTLVGGTEAANTEVVQISLSRVPSLELGAILRHVFPSEELWTWNPAELRLVPATPTRIENVLVTFADEPLVNASVLDFQLETGNFPEGWRPYCLYFLGSSYLTKTAREGIRIAYYQKEDGQEEGVWVSRLEHITNTLALNARIPVFR